ncbi:MAG TPA: UDP-2,4-diacetamido-2,4,6-trideoxy-beta-L-altropyranose hydrolase [Pseudomonadales bacterium]|nr:UDP-2,4-diacetamido-2,4,6-trideoxy-beta-L-altropyranose hydrolase [Pseudomonadales bacterium]
MKNKLRLAIRADASLMIGTGHIMRCFVIASRLVREFNAEVMFIMREHQGNLIEFVQQKRAFSLAVLPAGEAGHDVRPPYNQWLGETEQRDIAQTLQALKQFNPDWVLFDHYALGEKSHAAVKKEFGCGVAVLDDLADRALHCDVLIDHNCALDHSARYCGFIPEPAKTFFGPGYTPFRDELLQAARKINKSHRSGDKKRIFVFLGGGDTYASTKLVLLSLFSLPQFSELMVDVVVGMSCPNRDELESLCAAHVNVRYFCQTPFLGELMANADLAIGTGGINSSERVLLRLPSIAFALAENQKPGLACYDTKDCVHYLGDFADLSQAQLAAAIVKVLSEVNELARMQLACAAMIPTPGEQDGLAEICQYLKDHNYENR